MRPLLILRRDLRLASRRRSDIMTVLVFFVLVVSLFPLGVGPELALLKTMAPGVLWVAALLAALLALQGLFASDYTDGTLEQLALGTTPLAIVVACKVLVHWLVTGLPLVALSPLLGLQFGLGGESLWMLVLSLLLGTPVLSLVGSVGAALTLGLRGSGSALLALLVLPLYIPVLIFGAGAVEAVQAGLGADGHMALLGAMLAASAFFSPLVAAVALRIALE